MNGPSASRDKSPSSDSLYELVEQITERLQRGETIDLSQVMAAHPQHVERLQQIFPALQILADIRVSSTAAPAGGGSTRPASDALDGLLGDFRIVREIGRGGMGVVYEAGQISLDRRVALKVLPFAGVLDARQLQRFSNEARAAAGLHHPNIVPVYAVGCARGVHYYAMQYVDGQTLADVIRETCAPVSVRFRTIAEWGIQIAEALDYAHSVGVVHRDIKPANLMLDSQARVWITDFGLAQIETDAGLTMTGDIVGTLRYMSPEQALGERGLVDQRTDVYSLGLVLYELLTLKPAFGDANRRELLRRISGEDPIPPRRINPAIPVELETIVQKATEKEAVARYATARGLSDDLRRFLQEQPIKARPATPLDRLRKWSRRNRPIVTSAIAALCLSVVILAASTAWVMRERDAAQDAESRERDQALLAREAEQTAREQATIASQRQIEAEKSEQLAEARRRESQETLEAAKEVVDNMLSRVADGLADKPQMQPLRQELIARARLFYERFVQNHAGTRQARLDQGAALLKIAELQAATLDKAASAQTFRRAIAVYEDLFREFPEDIGIGMLLIHSLTGLVYRIESEAGVPKCYERTYEVSQSLLARYPTDVRLLYASANQKRNLGLALCISAAWAPADRRDYAQVDKAIELIHGGQLILKQLIQDDPDNETYRIEHAKSYWSLHDALRIAQRPLDELESAIRESCDCLRRTIARLPECDSARRELSWTLIIGYAAFLETSRHDFDKAEACLRESIELRRDLATRHPLTDAEYTAQGLAEYARFLQRRGRVGEAEAAYRDALSIYASNAVLAYDQKTIRRQRARWQWDLALLLKGQKHFDESCDSLHAAVDTYTNLLAENPKSSQYRHNLCGCYRMIASIRRLQAGTDHLRHVEAAFRKCLNIRQEAIDSDPPDDLTPISFARRTQTLDPVINDQVPDQRWGFVRDSLELAEVLEALKQHDDALAVCQAALPFSEKLCDLCPEAQEASRLRAMLRTALGESAEFDASQKEFEWIGRLRSFRETPSETETPP